ncbi:MULTISPECIES: hypothetical protein [unclassified Pseudoalteromonas]|jgi:TRAP-type C4-dicarboxylate transport system permease large subunit|uniref:hypothetical protein n=1 Tax=unclassified Pseudoalteromonas TaxID=194690 RepID=UPI001485C72F|nr:MULTISPECIES: hypothetical protein [unclassified Pseudoalteromonas]
MSIDQLFITAILAMLVGIMLCMSATYILARVKKYYYKVTFKHEVLEPYTPNNKKKDEQ